jgi:hypothetical protein
VVFVIRNVDNKDFHISVHFEIAVHFDCAYLYKFLVTLWGSFSNCHMFFIVSNVMVPFTHLSIIPIDTSI